MRRKAYAVLAAAMLAAVTTTTVGAARGPSPGGRAPAPDSSHPPITLRVSCNTNPEVTTIKSNRSFTMRIWTIRSLYRPRAGVEPFFIPQLLPAASILRAGGTRVFHTHSRAFRNVLSKQAMYNSDNADGAHVVIRIPTRTGFVFRSFARRCTP